MSAQLCPDCKNPLKEVRYNPDTSPLNQEQFDAVRAGDYFCTTCKGSRGNTKYRYFWSRELERFNQADATAEREYE